MREIKISSLEQDSFSCLLGLLDPDPEIAGEKYMMLRLKLTRVLYRKECPEFAIEYLVDIALDRTGKKCVEGEPIENAEAYANGVIKYVFLEFRRGDFVIDRPDILPEPEPEPERFDELDDRLACLRSCLAGESDTDRLLLLGYYDAEGNEKNKDLRKKLAERLDLTMSNLKVKAFRIRTRVSDCVKACMKNRLQPVTQ